jgi:hypothetical protein
MREGGTEIGESAARAHRGFNPPGSEPEPLSGYDLKYPISEIPDLKYPIMSPRSFIRAYGHAATKSTCADEAPRSIRRWRAGFPWRRATSASLAC